ncbi:hypothetical protein ACFDTO_17335 [Microbacteriaceae bacterium 4G12]
MHPARLLEALAELRLGALELLSAAGEGDAHGRELGAELRAGGLLSGAQLAELRAMPGVDEGGIDCVAVPLRSGGAAGEQHGRRERADGASDQEAQDQEQQRIHALSVPPTTDITGQPAPRLPTPVENPARAVIRLEAAALFRIQAELRHAEFGHPRNAACRT